MNKAKYGDIYLLITVVLLTFFGFLMIYSSSSYNALQQFGDSLYYVKKQAIAWIFAVIGMIGITKIKSEQLYKSRYYLLIIALVLLVLVFIPGVGVENYGAKRWINVGFGTIQPSEISKFLFIIFVACYLSKVELDKFYKTLPVLGAGAMVCLLVMLEPNMSITVCIALAMMGMLYIGGMSYKHIIALCIPLLALAVVLILLEPYRLDRLRAFLNPWESPKGEGYQLIQSYYALGSGGWFGIGLFNSRQKYMFLPFAESDFILSVIGEELGFCGVLVLMAIYLFIIYRGIVIAKNAISRQDCYLASGITMLLAVQGLLNMAVVSGAIPPTGLPLPFVSAGGSSLVAYYLAVGLLLGIAKTSSSQKNITLHSI